MQKLVLLTIMAIISSCASHHKQRDIASILEKRFVITKTVKKDIITQSIVLKDYGNDVETVTYLSPSQFLATDDETIFIKVHCKTPKFPLDILRSAQRRFVLTAYTLKKDYHDGEPGYKVEEEIEFTRDFKNEASCRRFVKNATDTDHLNTDFWVHLKKKAVYGTHQPK